MRSYLDSGISFVAWRGEPAAKEKALQILADPRLILVSSPIFRLETLTKAAYRKNADELEYLHSIFRTVSEWVSVDDRLIDEAIELGRRYDIVNLDALHAPSATRGRVERFITTEKPGKPLYRVEEFTTTYFLDF